MDVLEIKPLELAPDARLTMPGSKSYTQRALIAAALAEGISTLKGALLSDDTVHLMEALASLGVRILVREEGIIVYGGGGRITRPTGEIRLGNNGTAMRFLVGIVSLGSGRYVLTGDRRLCERPIGSLVDALRDLGIEANTKGQSGFPPVVVQANGFPGGKVVLRNIESSQFLSSLLMCGPYGHNDLVIELEGDIPSLPYVEMTLEVMKKYGVEVVHDGLRRFVVKGGQIYHARQYVIEGDASSASYFFLIVALCGGRVRIDNIPPRTLQGDIGILNIMEMLGCTVARGDEWVSLSGAPLLPGPLRLDLKDMPDMVPNVAVLAAVRSGQTVIENVQHLRMKESDRLAALAAELRKTGIHVTESRDGLTIEGGKPHAAEIETYDDHRIAMSFAALGLAVPGMKIINPGCVNKSFPAYWEELEGLRGR